MSKKIDTFEKIDTSELIDKIEGLHWAGSLDDFPPYTQVPR